MIEDILSTLRTKNKDSIVGAINEISASIENINIPDATTAVKGIVQLDNTVISTSTNKALTAAQGKVLKDTIDSTNTQLNGSLNLLSTALLDHDKDLAKHNQFMDGGRKKQLVFGINPELGCLTVDIQNV